MNYQGLMEITKIENIADDVYEMTLKGEGAKYIRQPGQFINIKINESLQPYLRRPMSISDYDENTIVRAFDEGAQDYIVKPFRIRELLARVRRILSANIKNGEKDNIIYMGHAAIHTDEAKVYVNDKSIELTALEYRLLLIFASNKGILLTRQQILDKIWDADGNFVEDNTLTVYVKRLREKLGEAIHIETVRGMGYRVD